MQHGRSPFFGEGALTLTLLQDHFPFREVRIRRERHDTAKDKSNPVFLIV